MANADEWAERYRAEAPFLDHRRERKLGPYFWAEADEVLDEVPVESFSDLCLVAALALARGAEVVLPPSQDEGYLWIDAPVADALAITFRVTVWEVDGDEGEPEKRYLFDFAPTPLIDVAADPELPEGDSTVGWYVLSERLRSLCELIKVRVDGEDVVVARATASTLLADGIRETASVARLALARLDANEVMEVRASPRCEDETWLVFPALTEDEHRAWISIWVDGCGQVAVDTSHGLCVPGPELSQPPFTQLWRAVADRLDLIQSFGDVDLPEIVSVADFLPSETDPDAPSLPDDDPDDDS